MHVDQGGEGLNYDETKMSAWIPSSYLCVERPRMAPKLWRQSYGAKGMHAFIDYQRSVICYHQMSSACAHDIHSRRIVYYII